MRFTDVQQKQVIDLTSGKFLGYIVDADVNEQSGYIEKFHVAAEQKLPYFSTREPAVRKVHVREIVSIGQDVILVRFQST